MLTFGLGFGQTSLGAGELAITGVNSGIEGDSSDAFSFVLLTDVEDGTIINFTDTGWLASGRFYNVSTDGALLSEGMITWTASSSLNCGTEIIITDTGSNNWSVSPAVGTALESDQGFTLSRSGDQIIAFQGTTLVPEFLFALHFANGSNWTDAVNTNQSALPTGLTDGINAVHISRDNIVYNYNILGNTNLILAALVNPNEWLGSSSNYQTLGIPGGGVFTCDTTILEEGDLAITGVNTTDSDQFSFILLTDILRGTEINFTDKSWDTTGTFILDSSNDPVPEGIVKWTATSDLNCGTEIIITGAGGNIWSATLGEAVESEDGFLFNETGGDQIIAFQSNIWTPQLKYALHFGNSNGWTDAVDNKNSAVPAGLTNGINAVAFNKDNCIYNYSVTSNQSLILAATVDPLNWTGDDTIRQTLGISSGSISCTTPNTCFSTTIWNGSSWSNGDPDMSKHIKISSNYSTSINSLMACSLTVDYGFTLTVENGTFLAIQNDAVINGTLMVEHQGNFVQNNSNGTITLGPSGSCVLNKTTPLKPNYYYYTYWSSPVVNETIGNVFPLVGADRRYRFNAQNYLDNAPTDDVDDNNNDWEIAVAEDTMVPGVG
ncbi:hypothetical protein GCM10007028_22960 [Algibacter mikhailovii]|uniref:Uncharacterized protein n=2 Tax=Algibacter mikhailovii TaxID=425498 RepID=A0A918VAQ8_9FLAO|nr:hypothetical protein GCM10007028_22960 [Algibacter mikhailovii]